MNKDSILLLTKDAQCKSYYPCYGNEFYKGKTPNMDELAAKGTIFHNCYTVAPSSAMSYLGMFTGKYPYELNIQRYVHVGQPYNGVTLFDKANDLGFETHVFWDEHWYKMAFLFSNCYGKNTEIHYLNGLRRGVGPMYKRGERLELDENAEKETFEMVRKELDSVTSGNKKIFIWFHMPHAINGRRGYADDIDLYDNYIGLFREYFNDNNIFISADHGNMNGFRGKLRYGFDVYEPAINIPLISPRIEGLTECSALMSNKDFFDLIFKRKIVESEFVIVDSTYYAQPRRKTAIIWKNYRYIYNKETKTEELYDIEWDRNQQYNLINDWYDDPDRKCKCLASELYFYPYWEELTDVRNMMREKRLSIWREPSFREMSFIVIKESLSKNKIARMLFTPIKNYMVKKESR